MLEHAYKFAQAFTLYLRYRCSMQCCLFCPKKVHTHTHTRIYANVWIFSGSLTPLHRKNNRRRPQKERNNAYLVDYYTILKRVETPCESVMGLYKKMPDIVAR